MKYILWFLLAIVLLLAALFAWIWFGAAGPLPRVAFSDATELQRMIGFAPDDEDEVFVIPSVGPLYAALRSSEVTADGVARMAHAEQIATFCRLLGRSPAIAWSRSGKIFMVAKPSPLRAGLISLAAGFSGASMPVERRGDYLMVGEISGTEAPLTIASSLADAEGNFFVFHRGGKNSFPPLSRPAISAVDIDDRTVRVTSVSAAAAGEGQASPAPGVVFSVPSDAIGAALLTPAADVVRDLDRFLPFDFARLAAGGAMLVIYDVETGSLLPRPRGLLALPETPAAADAVASLFDVAAVPGSGTGVTSRSVGPVNVDRIERFGSSLETARYGGEVLLGFDESSIEKYLRAEKSDLTAPAGTLWRFDADAARLRPLAADLAGDRALKFAAGRISRSARQVDSILRLFSGAKRISAVKRRDGGRERVEMTISGTK